MDRRDFLKSSSVALAVATIESRRVAGIATNAPNSSAGRLVLPMNRNWRFSPQRLANDTARDFNDSRFDVVTIPHTNKKLPWHSFDEKSYQFVSIYRRRFKLPPEARGHHVFVDFDGAMTASIVWFNGQRLGEYKGGYTAFTFEVTHHVDWDGDNVLAVELDSTERKDIPPFGGAIDYLTFGGIYRDVTLRLVPASYLENVFVRPKNVLSDHPSVDVSCFVSHLEPHLIPLTLEVELRDGERVLSTASRELPPGSASAAGAQELTLTNFGSIKRWDLSNPYLYTVRARIKQGQTRIDQDQRRTGFREARFTDHGFELN